MSKHKRELVGTKKYRKKNETKKDETNKKMNQIKIHLNFEMILIIFPGHQPVLRRLNDDITQSLSA